MSYFTAADFAARLTVDELIELADLDGDGTADDAVLAEAIADAEALVDSYVATRVAVPLSPVPAHVKTITGVIAVYNLYARRRSITESVKASFDAAVSYLKDVAAGKVTLGDAAQVAGAPHPAAQSGGDDRQFSRTQLPDW